MDEEDAAPAGAMEVGDPEVDEEDDEEDDGEEEEEDEDEQRWLLAEGESGGAVWDLWRADDAPAICAFLRKVALEEGRPPPIHGIHDQQTYLDANLRRRLASEAGVVGWRFVQKQGEAIRIRDMIHNGEISFNEAAFKFSEDKAGAYGLLGDKAQNELDPDFWAAALTCKEGDWLREPIKTQWGWHIIMCAARRPPPSLPPAHSGVSFAPGRAVWPRRVQARLTKKKK